MTAGLQDARTAAAAIRGLRTRLSAPPTWQDPLLCFDPDALPPLPVIGDATIARQVLLHRSTSKSDPSVVSRIQKSYEPLEALGDRILGYEVYRRLQEQRPDATPGVLGVSRWQIVTWRPYSTAG